MEKFNSEQIYTLIARKLSGEATARELAELDMLLRENPNVNYSLEILQDIWKSQGPVNRQYAETRYKELELKLRKLGIDDNHFDTPGDDYIKNNEPLPGKKRTSRRLFLALASIILVACITLAFYRTGDKKTTPSTTPTLVATKYGSKTRLLLADGTAVTLNADSRLEYPENFEGNTREVHLEGEGFFEVAHNGKPFIIHTHAMDIKVLGTVFNVKAYANEKTSEASLIKGSIEVTLNNGKNDKVILKPNEKITIANTSEQATARTGNNNTVKAATTSTSEPANTRLVTINELKPDSKENVIKEIAWTQNKLMFKNENLEDIAVLLKRWYGQEVILQNDNLKGLKFTGTYYQENLEEVLESLQMANSFKMKNENNQIVIY